MTTDNGVIRAAEVHADSMDRVADAIDRVADALVLAVGVLSRTAEEGEKDPGVAESPDKPYSGGTPPGRREAPTPRSTT